MNEQTQTADLHRYGIDSRWRHTAPAERRILFVYAHPDDEAFGNAGTIIHYANAGVAVHYACATRGEVGSIDPKLLEGYANTGALRTAEQLCAAEALDLAGVHFLNHRDSGMQGSEDNQNPNALVRQPVELVTGQVVALIRTIRPQIVITFNSYGGYGHPDHIACHKATYAAFDQASDPACYPEQIADGLSPWQPEKLYIGTFGPYFLRIFIFIMRLLGRDPRQFGRNKDVDMVKAAEAVTPITTSVASLEFLERKERAWSCHKSQGGGPRAAWVPALLRRYLSANEHFTRVKPEYHGSAIEREFFGGVALTPNPSPVRGRGAQNYSDVGLKAEERLDRIYRICRIGFAEMMVGGACLHLRSCH